MPRETDTEDLYQKVVKQAQREADYSKLPEPPEEYSQSLREAHEMIDKDEEVSKVRQEVKEYINKRGEHPGHGMKHFEIVARVAGAIAGVESQKIGLSENRRNQVMKESIIGGYLHDIGRPDAKDDAAELKKQEKQIQKKLEKRLKEREEYLDEEDIDAGDLEGELKQLKQEENKLSARRKSVRHQSVSKRMAKEMLDQKGIRTNHVLEAIEEHENPSWEPTGDELRDIVVGSVYDADKIIWGPPLSLKRAWTMAEEKGIPPRYIKKEMEKGWNGAILGKLKKYAAGPEDEENFKTRLGKEYGPDLIQKGVEFGKKAVDILEQETDQEEVQEGY